MQRLRRKEEEKQSHPVNIHPLQQRVQRVAAKASRLRWLYALAWVSATLGGCILLWGLVDSVLHVADSGVRAIVSLAILAVTLYVVWKRLWPAAGQGASDLAVAQRIEQQFPQLGDRLSSSLAFLAQDESETTAGSATLRRAVIADTMARSDGLNFTEVLDRRPTRRVLLVLGLVLAIAGVLTALSPSSTGLVLTRTFWPWTTAAWPRRNALEFEKPPHKLAIGSDFEVTLVDKHGHLPDKVTLLYWFDGEPQSQAQVREMKLLGGKMVHRLENVTRGFKYRALGGDDQSMAWNELQVLEPPHVTALDIKVHPPEYTGWPVEAVTPDFRALAGSRVELAAQVDKPIQAGKITFEGATPSVEYPLTIAEDGLSMRLPLNAEQPWIVTPANAYTLELTSVDGLTSQQARHELRVVQDRPPVVAIEKPADNALVTLQAIVPVRVLVKEDLAIARVELRYLRSDQSAQGEQAIVLYQGAERAAAVKKSPLNEAMLAGETRTVEFAWNISELANLQPGVTLTWHVAALDFLPQTGLSPTQRLTIISQNELEDRIAQRQGAILMQLHDVLRQQIQAHAQISSLDVQLQNLKRLGKQDLDALLGADLNQRQVLRALSGEGDGVLAQIASLLSELEVNRLDSPEVARRMKELASEIGRLTKEPLPLIERELTTAQKLVRDDLDKRGDLPADGSVPTFDEPTSAATKQALSIAGEQQDETIASLERLLGDLSQWDNYRRFAREMSRLRSDQETVRKQTQEMQAQTLSKNLRDLTPAEASALKRLAQRQTDLSRQFDKLLGRMTDAQTELKEGQPLAAETIADALDAARRMGISSQMLDTARGIERNQLGTAGEGQTEIGQSLGDLLDILANRKEHELGRRLAQLRTAAEEVDSLVEKVKGLRERLKAAAKVGNEAERKRQLERLTKEEKRLAEESQRLARRLERLQAEQAGGHAGAAGAKLNQASEQQSAAQSLEEATQSQKHLEDAQQQLQQDIAQTQQDLFFEQVAKLEQAIQGLVERQQAVLKETERLETLKTNQQGEWTPSQRTSVRSLSDQQRDLVAETTAFLPKLAQAPAFGLALQGAVREMTRAAARLEKALTDAATQNAEKIAHDRLAQLLTALKPEEASPPEEQPPMDPPGGQPPPMPPGDALNLLTELKLLRLMQAEINRRTLELEKLQSSVQLTPDQAQELDELATEQGQLANLVQELAEKGAQSAPQNPAAPLPATDEDAEKSKNPLDNELEKALDNELLPGRQ